MAKFNPAFEYFDDEAQVSVLRLIYSKSKIISWLK